MPVGDDAVTQGYPLVPDTGEEGRVRWGAREINRTRDLIAVVRNLIKFPWSVAQGGTGGTTATEARDGINAAAKPPFGGYTVSSITTNHAIGLRYNGNRPVVRVDNTEWELAFKNDADKAVPVIGGRPVGDITSAHRIGLRWNGSKPVFRVNDTEYELARLIDVGNDGGKADAFQAVNQVRLAYGTNQAHAREAGSNRYAVWVDGGHQFGRATSSRRYKDDIRAWDIDPQRVLALEPVSFHRKVDDPGTRDHGLIAEEVHKTLPEIIQFFQKEGEDSPQIDGIHYELLSVALLSVVKDQERRITALESLLKDR